MSFNARRSALSCETRTPIHPFFLLPCPSSFDTAGGRCDLFHMPGGSGENNHPGTHRTPPSNAQNSPQDRSAGQGQGIHTPNTFQAVTGAMRGLQGQGEIRGRDGTHQPHRIISPPALAATTHHPSPTARPNRMPTLRSHHHLGHT